MPDEPAEVTMPKDESVTMASYTRYCVNQVIYTFYRFFHGVGRAREKEISP